MCNSACQAKIILNSGNGNGIMRANDRVINRLTPAEFEKLNGDKVIELLNRIEDDAVSVQKLLVKAADYAGPTGKILQD